MTNTYPESIKKIASEFLEILEKYYPELVNKTFDNYGFVNREGNPAKERMEMVLYIELLKAGVFKDV